LFEQPFQAHSRSSQRRDDTEQAPPELRRELSQEIHLALWRSLAKFNGRCSIRTWTYRVAHNVATSHVVRQAKGKSVGTFLTLEETEGHAVSEDGERSADRAQALSRLFALIQQFDPLDRQVIMAYLEGLDAESIAEITGLAAANVWSKIHRIKTMLVRRFHRGVRNAVSRVTRRVAR
jgi:RNA polymerase sigma-70 factor (ECF subfamily)